MNRRALVVDDDLTEQAALSIALRTMGFGIAAPAEITQRMAVFSALSSDARLQCLSRVAKRGEASATMLGVEMSLSRQLVAFHLAALSKAGLLVSRRAGRETLYSVQVHGLDTTALWLLELAAHSPGRR